MSRLTAEYIKTLNFGYARRNPLLSALEKITLGVQDAVSVTQWPRFQSFGEDTDPDAFLPSNVLCQPSLRSFQFSRTSNEDSSLLSRREKFMNLADHMRWKSMIYRRSLL